MTSLAFDIPKFAGRLASDAKYQARLLVSKPGKHCHTCKMIRSPKLFDRGSHACRRCAGAKVVPNCHPMLLRAW